MAGGVALQQGSDLISRLEEGVRSHVLAEMQGASAELAKQDLAELLMTYRTWRSRFVRQRPRHVRISPELNANAKLGKHRPALEEIVKRIETGADLTPFLSTKVKTAYEPVQARKTLHQRRDRDLLLAEWGIHHLHFSTTVGPDGFVVCRTADLLFAAFTDEDAYLIDIYEHGDWALLDVAEILVRNWPESGVLREVQGVIGLAQHFSDEERLELRNAGVSGLLEIDGKVFASPGQTTAGTPLETTLRVNEFMWELERLRAFGDDVLTRHLNELAGKSTDGEWEPAVHDQACGFQSGDVFVAVRRLSY